MGVSHCGCGVVFFLLFWQDYIQRFGRGSNAKQAQSKEKVLAKMVAGGLAEKVVQDKVVAFSFPDCGDLPPPVIMVQQVSFRYTKDKVSLSSVCVCLSIVIFFFNYEIAFSL